MQQFIEWFGWGGAVAVLLAYGLMSFSVISSASIFFQLLNLVGAIGIGLVSFRKHAYQPAILNLVWGLIALVSLLRILLSLS